MRGGHQPFRKGARAPGQSLDAMLRGRPMFLPNPMDTLRGTQRRSRFARRHRARSLSEQLLTRM